MKFQYELLKDMCMHAKLTVDVLGMSSQKLHNPPMSWKDRHMVWFGGPPAKIWFNDLIQSTHYDAKKQHQVLEQVLVHLWM